VSQNNVIDLDQYREKKQTPPLLAFHVDHFYTYPEFELNIQVLGITDKSVYFDRHPMYILQDQSGQVYTLPLDENSCVGWKEITRKEYIDSITVPSDDEPPPNVS